MIQYTNVFRSFKKTLKTTVSSNFRTMISSLKTPTLLARTRYKIINAKTTTNQAVTLLYFSEQAVEPLKPRELHRPSLQTWSY